MKLKTLKDLECLKNAFESDVNSGVEIAFNNIKHEAIEWVKALNTPQTDMDDGVIESKFWKRDNNVSDRMKFIPCKNIEFVPHEVNDKDGAITILKHFFNITEEDLK